MSSKRYFSTDLTSFQSDENISLGDKVADLMGRSRGSSKSSSGSGSEHEAEHPEFVDRSGEEKSGSDKEIVVNFGQNVQIPKVFSVPKLEFGRICAKNCNNF